MLVHLKLWRLQVYLVLGRVYQPSLDCLQRSCLRLAWGPHKLFAIGARPGE